MTNARVAAVVMAHVAMNLVARLVQKAAVKKVVVAVAPALKAVKKVAVLVVAVAVVAVVENARSKASVNVLMLKASLWRWMLARTVDKFHRMVQSRTHLVTSRDRIAQRATQNAVAAVATATAMSARTVSNQVQHLNVVKPGQMAAMSADQSAIAVQTTVRAMTPRPASSLATMSKWVQHPLSVLYVRHKKQQQALTWRMSTVN